MLRSVLTKICQHHNPLDIQSHLLRSYLDPPKYTDETPNLRRELENGPSFLLYELARSICKCLSILYDAKSVTGAKNRHGECPHGRGVSSVWTRFHAGKKRNRQRSGHLGFWSIMDGSSTRYPDFFVVVPMVKNGMEFHLLHLEDFLKTRDVCCVIFTYPIYPTDHPRNPANQWISSFFHDLQSLQHSRWLAGFLHHQNSIPLTIPPGKPLQTYKNPTINYGGTTEVNEAIICLCKKSIPHRYTWKYESSSPQCWVGKPDISTPLRFCPNTGPVSTIDTGFLWPSSRDFISQIRSSWGLWTNRQQKSFITWGKSTFRSSG